MTLRDLDSNTADSIKDVEISMVNGDPRTARLESDDPIALMTAVCIAVNNGSDFIDGGDDWAIIRK